MLNVIITQTPEHINRTCRYPWQNRCISDKLRKTQPGTTALIGKLWLVYEKRKEKRKKEKKKKQESRWRRLGQALPRFRGTPMGFFIMCLALGLSLFSTTTTHLILSQGISYGIGANLAYAPTILFMDDWFARKKGLAFGIMWVSFH